MVSARTRKVTTPIVVYAGKSVRIIRSAQMADVSALWKNQIIVMEVARMSGQIVITVVIAGCNAK
jgi:hypothetical protein